MEKRGPGRSISVSHSNGVERGPARTVWKGKDSRERENGKETKGGAKKREDGRREKEGTAFPKAIFFAFS